MWAILGDEPPHDWLAPKPGPEPYNPDPGFGIPITGPNPDPGFYQPLPPGQATGIPFPRMRLFDGGQPFATPAVPGVYGPPAPSGFGVNAAESGLFPVGHTESPGERITGFAGDAIDGAKSYFRGIGRAGDQIFDAMGATNIQDQTAARDANETLGGLAKKLVQNPGYIDDAAEIAGRTFLENPGKVLGRLGAGAGAGYFLKSAAIPLGLAAMYGDIIQAIKNGASAKEAIAAALLGSEAAPPAEPPAPTGGTSTPPKAPPSPEEKPK